MILLSSNTVPNVSKGHLKEILLSYFRDAGKRIFMSLSRDPLFFRFVNRDRDRPCTTFYIGLDLNPNLLIYNETTECEPLETLFV